MKTATLATIFAAALAQAQVQGIDGDAARRLQQMAQSYSDSIGQLRDEFTAFLNSNPGASGSLANDLAWKTVGVSDSIGRAQGQLADLVGTLDWALSTQQPGGSPGPAGGAGPVDQGPGAGPGPADNQGPGAGAGPADNQGPGAGAGPADNQQPAGGAGPGPAEGQGDDEGFNRKNVGAKFRRF